MAPNTDDTTQTIITQRLLIREYEQPLFLNEYGGY